MNAVSIMFVNDHLESLRAEAHQHRAASLAERRSLRDRIASGATELRRILGHEADGPAIPSLKEYPYAS